MTVLVSLLLLTLAVFLGNLLTIVVLRAERTNVERHREAAKPQSCKPWSKLYPCCTKCGRTDRPVHGHGLCRRCYWSQYTRPSRRQK